MISRIHQETSVLVTRHIPVFLGGQAEMTPLPLFEPLETSSFPQAPGAFAVKCRSTTCQLLRLTPLVASLLIAEATTVPSASHITLNIGILCSVSS